VITYRFTKVVTIVVTAVALVVGIPQSARAEAVNITETTITVNTEDPSEINFWDDSWTLSFCSKSKAAKKSYVQVKSGKKWKKLTNVSKTKTIKNVSQCKKSYPYLTEFTYTETKASKRQYRVYVPGQSGYKPHFKVSKVLASSSGSEDVPSKLQDCYFGSKKLAGSVYFSNSKLGSDFTIYESGSSIGSDLSVYYYPASWTGVNVRSIAKCGQWIYAASSSPFDADFIVYRTSSPELADFVINYVTVALDAGLN